MKQVGEYRGCLVHAGGEGVMRLVIRQEANESIVESSAHLYLSAQEDGTLC